MQLLGIEILRESPVNRILSPGWYPFGAFEKPDKNGFVKRSKSVPEWIEKIYSEEDLPDVTISAIVGKNGCGKSSLIEILFRIINNFARTVLGKERSENSSRHLCHAYNVFARLYYAIDGIQYRIECNNIDVTLHRIIRGQNPRGYYIKGGSISDDTVNSILNKFFYTIVTNYSLYAYNVNEYRYEKENSSNKNSNGGEWLNGLFHKNDAYYTPIVITPYRKDGAIDMENEKRLSLYRILKLAILAHSKNKILIPGYRPSCINIKFNPDFKELKQKQSQELFLTLPKFLHNQEQHFLSAFEKIWRKKLLIPSKMRYDKIISTAISYLAYKSLKLAVMYRDYGAILKLRGKDRVYESNFIEYVDNTLPSQAEILVEGMMDDFNSQGEHNHLISKLEQTVKFLSDFLNKGNYKWHDGDVVSVRNFIAEIKPETYSDISAALPPPFFELDLTFKRDKRIKVKDSSWKFDNRDELRVSQMSSGERQFLNAISYVLYHIKNLESVHPDKERVKYHNICLVFDEMELYFHPDYQRTFISRIIESLRWCKIDKSIIHSIQILLVTHSPFVLSDVFTHNTLYLDNYGQRCKVKAETFGANYYSMLSDSFFFSKSATGDISTRFISTLVKDAKSKSSEIGDLIDYVVDDFIKNYIISLKH